ncbi:hypothetical protein SGRA_1772 [Saprospira grandis str. Lewin]|uniref:Uncharacterized protein n=1 Tax=Saprospira grandis (strain Lewin) TaxID=984262 RepID=H6KZB7_SAPGL|nr:hypothetical protein SGRA_1772 [Saprospira grandis str. Lewin]
MLAIFLGLPTRFARVGPLRSSQVCSALQRLRRFGLPPSAALLQPLSRRPSALLKTVLLRNLLLLAEGQSA